MSYCYITLDWKGLSLKKTGLLSQLVSLEENEGL
jgi:hypothetical protein